MSPTIRPRRLRRTAAIRNVVRETRLDPAMLVLPIFVVAESGVRQEISSMPGTYQWSVDQLDALVGEADELGIGGVLLFGIPADKDAVGSSSWDPHGPVPLAIARIKELAPSLLVWADVCLCEYTTHGHCGVLAKGTVDNDATLPLLARAATAYAKAGADVIAPSDMMDARIGVIRSGLDQSDFEETLICSYSAKYASAFYGPFRDAVDSSLAEGDRRSHQMDPANLREARREVALDVAEGADMIMVKPAGPYLDVIAQVRNTTDLPVVAYQVSGEYSSLVAGAQLGWIDGDATMMESLLGIRRAGADIIISYFALRAARVIRDQQ